MYENGIRKDRKRDSVIVTDKACLLIGPPGLLSLQRSLKARYDFLSQAVRDIDGSDRRLKFQEW
jgi:hypothetical protein